MFGEYAAFIVPSYAVTAIAFALAVIKTFISYKARKRELTALESNKQ